MRFIDRDDIEYVSRNGVYTVHDRLGTRCRQLGYFWLYIDPEDAGYTPHAKQDGYWESWITMWMDRNVSNNSNVIDIGANHGYYSFFLASKGCSVTAIEPQPKLAKLISNSNEANSNIPVGVYNMAVSNSSGLAEMMVPIHHGMNATISNEHSYAPDGFETITVSTIKLDAFADFKIDFIKIDAEGGEEAIWAGGAEFRERNPDCLYLLEWRWDRYKNPERFAQELLDNYDISHVGFDSEEHPVLSVEQIGTIRNADWMFVLRSKQ